MDKFKNAFLNKIFCENQEQYALVYEEQRYTYDDLCNNVINKINLLTNLGEINTVGIIGDYDFESISLFLACIELNKIIVPFINENEISNKLTEINCDIIFKGDEYQIQQKNHKNHDLIQKLINENKPGLILFSSGSTGVPKAVVHNFEAIIDLHIAKQYNPTKTLGIFLPDHIAGIDVMLSVLGTGGSLVIPKSRKPKDVLEAMQRYKVEILPASPTLLRLLTLSEMEKCNLDSLKLIVYGSERMDSNLLQLLQKILPNVRCKQSFGTSETNAIKTRDHDTKEGYFKIMNCSYKILNNELYLKSKTQALGYLNADNSVFDDEGYFATGDLVEVIHKNNEEYIKIIGRNKEVINVGGEKVLPQEVEGILMQIPFIQDCLVYGQNNPLTGQSVCVKIVLQKNENLNALEAKKRIRMFCKDKLTSYKIPTKVEIVQKLEISERFKKVRK